MDPEEYDKAFYTVKDMLSKEILNNSFDPDKQSTVIFDANKFAICAVLIQEGKVISCVSRCLNKHQRNWATIERELFAFTYSLKKFRIFLLGHFFVGKTDHKPLIGLLKKIDSIENQRLLTMVLATTEFSFEIEYIPGKKNILADFGTRHIPLTDWPIQEEDPLELNSLLPFHNFTSIEFPVLHKRLYNQQDFEEFEKFQWKTMEKEDCFTTIIKKEEKILVPVTIRRSVFWATHFPNHQGFSQTLRILKDRHFFWPNMKKDVAEFLSTCVCAIKKTDKFKKKAFARNWLKALRVLHILAIDIYEYEGKQYLTFLDIFSGFPFAEEISSKQEIEVKRAFDKFCSLFAVPESIFSDNGTEFNLINVPRHTTPANFPQPNGKLERLHKEIGKLCRIHSFDPTQAVSLLQTLVKEAIFYNGLQLAPVLENEEALANFSFSSLKPESFQLYDFVYREVQLRKRAKHHNTYTGPHMITKVISPTVYIINSHKNYSGEIKAHYNQLKPFSIPDTSYWILNITYLKNALVEMGLELFKGINVVINFKNLSILTLQLLNSDVKKVFVIPEWLCAPWYKPLHGVLKTRVRSVKLPSVPDLFTDTLGNPLGVFSYDHWLFATASSDDFIEGGTYVTFSPMK